MVSGGGCKAGGLESSMSLRPRMNQEATSNFGAWCEASSPQDEEGCAKGMRASMNSYL